MLPKIENIVYGTALGAGAPYVFRQALGLAQQTGATVTIVHAIEPLSTFGRKLVELHVSHDQAEELHQRGRDQVRRQIEEHLEKFCAAESCKAETGAELIAAIRVVEGQPADVLIEEARNIGADLIVIGTHQHTALGEALLGHTANKVSHRSEIPVMLVRIPEGYSEPGF